MRASIWAAVVLLMFLNVQRIWAERKPYVLLSENEARAVSMHCSRSGPQKVTGSWRPINAQLEILESNLQGISMLRGKKGGLPGAQVKEPSRYYRQYVGVIVESRKLIYVNAICSEPPSDWTSHLADMCDGSECAWGVLYDPATREFFDLQMNGGWK